MGQFGVVNPVNLLGGKRKLVNLEETHIDLGRIPYANLWSCATVTPLYSKVYFKKTIVVSE